MPLTTKAGDNCRVSPGCMDYGHINYAHRMNRSQPQDFPLQTSTMVDVREPIPSSRFT